MSTQPTKISNSTCDRNLLNTFTQMPQAKVRAWAPPTVSGATLSVYTRWGKRFLDVMLALAGLSISFPLVAVAAVAIRLESRGPIFFRQWRVGKHGKRFQIVKLRTMRDQAEFMGPKMTVFADPRITRVGEWLRKTKLDEIPQLINVLKGEMSFVGPRPKIPEQVITHSHSQEIVLDASPGLTGPATLVFIDEDRFLAGQENQEDFYLQVLIPIKLDLDAAYCRSITLRGDIKLIALTLVRLFYRPRTIQTLTFQQPVDQE